MIRKLRKTTAYGIRRGRTLPFLVFFVALIAANDSFAQSIAISGYVTDASNGEALVGTNLYEVYQRKGTTTNQYGFFSLTVPGDSTVIRFSYQGYATLTFTFHSSPEELQRIEMQPIVVESDSVLVVEADEYEGLHRQVQMSSLKVSMAEVEALPALLGETDLLKVFQLMPGIQSGVEGSVGLYVRGGTPGQTLILLDGATVYNAGHLFGFMSTFNTDAINSAELIKGGFPARYGGRLSGVLDVTMREGNRKEFEGRGAVGLLASRVTVEGPLAQGRSSFIVSARRTYLDAINWGIQKIRGSDYIQGYHFWDINAKWNLDISKRDRIYLSFYAGRDKGYENDQESLNPGDNYQDRFELAWSNATLTSRWNRVINARMFVNTTFLLSRFRSSILEQSNYRSGSRNSILEDRYMNGLTDVSIKTDLEYFSRRNHQIRFGGVLTRHLFIPSIQRHQELDSGRGVDTTVVIPLRVPTTEWSTYAEDEVTLTRWLKGNLGVHTSGYHTDGSIYSSIQPRASVSFLLHQEWAVKFSYARMRQYIQLLSNSGAGLPTDLWLPSTSRVSPQKAWQIAAGIARTIDVHALDISFEGYYKEIDGIIAYREGSNFVGSNQNWEDAITAGRGWAYGMEMYVRRKRGRTTGWVSYTLAWSKRRIPELNEGRIFPHRYDRRHYVSIALMHDLGRRKISATWVYSSGHALTLAHSRYRQDGILIDVYGSRNSYRTPSYHRLDLSVRRPSRQGKRSEVTVSLYNVYSRRNTFYLYTEEHQSLDPNVGYNIDERTIKKFTLLPIVPSVSYRFYF
ncbi:MAG: TonB-dependent receptor [Rhodothermaceae bacterium]|nr:TonB-dependent receptor [Rhodothermaceae bacterium]MYG68555.1 TonB-dependent receptor [Rhodothermaceae bacterium]MYJ44177.1 TonB-dependent receptor [Rhodothermaceae bacterium]